MKRLSILLLLLAGTAGADIPDNYADCIWNKKGCQVRHNMSGETIHIEAYDVVAKDWIGIVDDVQRRTDVPPGAFYRVAACDASNNNCEFSTMFWAPFVMPVKFLPTAVFARDPVTFEPMMLQVRDSEPERLSLVSYNVTLMEVMFAAVRGDLTYPMSQPQPHGEDMRGHHENLIHHNIYDYYTGALERDRVADDSTPN